MAKQFDMYLNTATFPKGEYGNKLMELLARMGLDEPWQPSRSNGNPFCDPRILDPSLTDEERKAIQATLPKGALAANRGRGIVAAKTAAGLESHKKSRFYRWRLLMTGAGIAALVVVIWALSRDSDLAGPHAPDVPTATQGTDGQQQTPSSSDIFLRSKKP